MYTRNEIIAMLSAEGEHEKALLKSARELRDHTIGNGIFLRGLIEYSNVCRKNCLYCGIRCDNETVARYTLTQDQVLAAAQFAYENRYGSVVLQGGELTSPNHIATIEELVRKIKALSSGKLGITLSLGEQSEQTYRQWFEAGAHRYLLRIESSTPDIYARIHPCDELHSFANRQQALAALRRVGYQVGTGVMIGLPGQTIENLADDLIFMRDFDIDMCGMGPYIESENTPLAQQSKDCPSLEIRLRTSLKMIAVLRHIMPDINIAATTAMQAIDPRGRIMAIEAGANIVMPNISPENLRESYSLYNNKPRSMDSLINECNVHYGEWGDSKHFLG